MPAERFFLHSPLQKDSTYLLKGTEFHHLTRVMRIREGESIEAVNGAGVLAIAKVFRIEKNEAMLVIEEIILQEAPNNCPIILVQAIPKPVRQDTILEKATELGASQIWLFPAELSVKKTFEPHQMERLEAIVISAMKQCGRLFLPDIKIMPPLTKWTEMPGSAFFGDVEGTAPLFSTVWKQCEKRFPVLFFVGPESGFTEQEDKKLRTLGAKGVKLHQNILRTETAPLVALSLIHHWILEGSSA